MAAGLVTHNITTAAGVTFTVASWVPNTAAPDVGAVPIAMLTDGTSVVALGTGAKAAALRVNYANDGDAITVLQGATNGGTWVVEGKPTGVKVPVTIDPSQLGSLIRNSVPVITGGYKYQSVAASATAALQSTTGAIGDYLETLVCVVSTPATSGVLIGDGITPATTVLPDNVAGGVGTYHIALGILSTVGSWRVTAHAGVNVFATGNWT